MAHNHNCSSCYKLCSHEDDTAEVPTIVFLDEEKGIYICSECSIDYETLADGTIQYRQDLRDLGYVPVMLTPHKTPRFDNLREYIEYNLTVDKDDAYYDENFAWNVQDYYGSKGEFTEDDIAFLEENQYRASDFTHDEEEEENIFVEIEVG